MPQRGSRRYIDKRRPHGDETTLTLTHTERISRCLPAVACAGKNARARVEERVRESTRRRRARDDRRGSSSKVVGVVSRGSGDHTTTPLHTDHTQHTARRSLSARRSLLTRTLCTFFYSRCAPVRTLSCTIYIGIRDFVAATTMPLQRVSTYVCTCDARFCEERERERERGGTTTRGTAALRRYARTIYICTVSTQHTTEKVGLLGTSGFSLHTCMEKRGCHRAKISVLSFVCDFQRRRKETRREIREYHVYFQIPFC